MTLMSTKGVYGEIIMLYLTEYKDSLRKKSSVWLDQIDVWTRLNQFGMFEGQENNIFLNENSVEGKHV